MKLGVSIPHAGKYSSPENIVKVAQRAEALGFNSVWTFERLLAPINPLTPYAGTADGKLPNGMRTVIDPLTTLTYVAAKTSKLELGVSVLNIPFYNPVVLARQLTAIRMLHRFMLEEGLRPDDPTADVEGVRVPAGIPHPLSIDEVERLLGAVVGDDLFRLVDRVGSEIGGVAPYRRERLLAGRLRALHLDQRPVRLDHDMHAAARMVGDEPRGIGAALGRDPAFHADRHQPPRAHELFCVGHARSLPSSAVARFGASCLSPDLWSARRSRSTSTMLRT